MLPPECQADQWRVRWRISCRLAIGWRETVGYDPQQEKKGIESHAENLSDVSQTVRSLHPVGWRIIEELQDLSLLRVGKYCGDGGKDDEHPATRKIETADFCRIQLQQQKAADSLSPC